MTETTKPRALKLGLKHPLFDISHDASESVVAQNQGSLGFK